MKKLIPLVLILILVACKKDKESDKLYIETSGFGAGVGGEYVIEIKSKAKGIILDDWNGFNTTHVLDVQSGDEISGVITVYGSGTVKVKYEGNYRLEAREGRNLLSTITIN